MRNTEVETEFRDSKEQFGLKITYALKQILHQYKIKYWAARKPKFSNIYMLEICSLI